MAPVCPLEKHLLNFQNIQFHHQDSHKTKLVFLMYPKPFSNLTIATQHRIPSLLSLDTDGRVLRFDSLSHLFAPGSVFCRYRISIIIIIIIIFILITTIIFIILIITIILIIIIAILSPPFVG